MKFHHAINAAALTIFMIYLKRAAILMRQKQSVKVVVMKIIGLTDFLKARKTALTNARNTVLKTNQHKANKMTVKQMYIELRDLGFPERLISKQTGIKVSKFKNMRYGAGARYSDAQKNAFEAYYRHAKNLVTAYGDALEDYVKAKEAECTNDQNEE